MLVNDTMNKGTRRLVYNERARNKDEGSLVSLGPIDVLLPIPFIKRTVQMYGISKLFFLGHCRSLPPVRFPPPSLTLIAICPMTTTRPLQPM